MLDRLGAVGFQRESVGGSFTGRRRANSQDQMIDGTIRTAERERARGVEKL